MADFSFPWTSVTGDRTISAEEARALNKNTVPNGVLAAFAGTTTGATVSMTAGAAMVEGAYYDVGTGADIDLSGVAGSTAKIVVRYDATARTVTLEAIEGDLVRSGGVWDLQIATVTFSGGVWGDPVFSYSLALLSEAQRAELVGGAATTLHKHSVAAADISGVLSTGQLPSALVSGGYTTLHKHSVAAADITGTISAARLPVGADAGEVLQLLARANPSLSSATYEEYAAASGWREFRTGASTYPARVALGTFGESVLVDVQASIAATTGDGSPFAFAVGTQSGIQHSGFVQSQLIASGYGGSVSNRFVDSTNPSSEKNLSLWVRTNNSTKVTLLGTVDTYYRRSALSALVYKL